MANSLANQFQVLGAERLSVSGALVIPSRLAFDELLVLGNFLKPREITYLLEAEAVLEGAGHAQIHRRRFLAVY